MRAIVVHQWAVSGGCRLLGSPCCCLFLLDTEAKVWQMDRGQRLHRGEPSLQRRRVARRNASH